MQMNDAKDVNSAKFDALRKKHIDLRFCPVCGNPSSEIIIDMSVFGKWSHRVYVACKDCGHQTKTYDAMTRVNDIEGKRYGNFMLEKSLVNAIRNAVNDWNGRSKNGT